MPRKFSLDVRATAVRLVREHREYFDSEWEAIVTVAGRGCPAETLRKWVRQAEIDEGRTGRGHHGDRPSDPGVEA